MITRLMNAIHAKVTVDANRLIESSIQQELGSKVQKPSYPISDHLNIFGQFKSIPRQIPILHFGIFCFMFYHISDFPYSI